MDLPLANPKGELPFLSELIGAGALAAGRPASRRPSLAEMLATSPSNDPGSLRRSPTIQVAPEPVQAGPVAAAQLGRPRGAGPLHRRGGARFSLDDISID